MAYTRKSKAEAKKSQVISLLNMGYSVKYAADIIGMTGTTLGGYVRQWRRETPELFKEI